MKISGRFSSHCSGFSGVECADPYSYAINELVIAKEEANVEQVLINSFQGKQLSHMLLK